MQTRLRLRLQMAVSITETPFATTLGQGSSTDTPVV